MISGLPCRAGPPGMRNRRSPKIRLELASQILGLEENRCHVRCAKRRSRVLWSLAGPPGLELGCGRDSVGSGPFRRKGAGVAVPSTIAGLARTANFGLVASNSACRTEPLPYPSSVRLNPTTQIFGRPPPRASPSPVSTPLLDLVRGLHIVLAPSMRPRLLPSCPRCQALSRSSA